MKVLDLYITKICNLNCEYCYVDVVRQADERLGSEDFLERVNLLQYDVIKFFGGEPLLKWKEICEIIQVVSAKKPKVFFSIISNGILLNKEKVEYVQERKNVEILISLHDPSVSVLKKKISLLRDLGKQGGLYIIFEPGDFPKAIAKFLYFFSKGIRYFTFAPEIYGDWNEQHLKDLEKILYVIQKYVKKNHLVIGGISSNRLKYMNYGCEKFVYDEQGNFQVCNRFKSLEKIEKFNYKQAYDYFDKEIGYKSDPSRWFSACPVGWYLDHIDGDLSLAAHRYKKLNKVFLEFHRNIFQDSYNFLTPNIEEIRFNLTRQCNIRCEYCYVDFKDEHLDFLTGKNIVDFFLEQESENKTISFFGGEPLLQFKTLKKLVEYSDKRSTELGKRLSYKIATNFMLMTPEVCDLLIQYAFEVHISFNGMKSLNDKMRDASSDLVLKNIEKYGDKIENKNIVILLAFSSFEAEYIGENIAYIYSLGFRKINLEMIFGKKYPWNKGSVLQAIKEIQGVLKTCKDLQILNVQKKHIFLDIDTSGKCSENSLDFYDIKIDTTYKCLFDDLISKIS